MILEVAIRFWIEHWQLLNWVPRVWRQLERVLEGTADRFSNPLPVASFQGWGKRERWQQEGTRLSFASCLFGEVRGGPDWPLRGRSLWGFSPDHTRTFLLALSSSVSSGKSQIPRNIINLKICFYSKTDSASHLVRDDFFLIFLTNARVLRIHMWYFKMQTAACNWL